LYVAAGIVVIGHATPNEAIHSYGSRYGFNDAPGLAWWFVWQNLPGWAWVWVPLWVPTVPPLIATGAAWRLDAVARRRARAGCCAKCGYDLRGLREGAVCPECGSPFSPAKVSALASAAARLWSWALRPRPRVRKTAKWGGLAMIVLVAGAYIASVWWSVSWTSVSESEVEVIGGIISVSWPTSEEALIARGRALLYPAYSGWTVGRNNNDSCFSQVEGVPGIVGS
jgi:hypothetical protein